jgi:hypothetical protein
MFPLSLTQLAKSLDRDSKELQKEFQENFKQQLSNTKHYFEKDGEIFFTKSGLVRLALLSQDEELSNFLEKSIDREVESIKEVEVDTVIKNLDTLLLQISDEMVKNREKYSLDDIEKFVNIFDKFRQVEGSSINSLMANTQKDAMKFASQTAEHGYNFASNMGKDAVNFTSDTRDKAHDFVMKTEDDAYNFASRMGKDAYKFAAKGMDYGYNFASKGMEYGYNFASKGEEVGEMANRVLWMASEIGIMADRIGEMADRIVHTEHLIVQTAMLIQNFGLLIDGTMKQLSDSILYGLTLLLDKEFEPVRSSEKNLEIISDITKEILKNNHEYDLAVLDKQLELRKITISALDKIKNNEEPKEEQ